MTTIIDAIEAAEKAALARPAPLPVTPEPLAPPRPRGFAALSPERHREIASMGGKAAQAQGSGHRWTADEARAVGARGGAAISSDREYMAAIGRRGAARTAAIPGHMAAIGRKGGATVSADREHMAAIGGKGGRSRARRRRGGKS